MKILKQIKMNKYHNKQNSGFTLIETMIAIIILSLALVPVLGLISNSLFISRYSNNEITANYLLQEVVDMVKNDRSGALINPTETSWTDFVDKYTNCSEEKGCMVNVKDRTIEACDSSGCDPLYYNEDATDGASFYNYDEENEVISNFTRKVVIKENSDNPDELLVAVTVSWFNGSEKVPSSKSLNVSILKWQ